MDIFVFLRQLLTRVREFQKDDSVHPVIGVSIVDDRMLFNTVRGGVCGGNNDSGRSELDSEA